MNLTCVQFEILLADYMDGTLVEEQRAAVANHLADCESCRELANDAAGAVAFIDRAAEVEVPSAMLQSILAEARRAAPQSWFERFFRDWLAPVLQPRVAMGFAMTVLSIAMIGRTLKPAHLDPRAAWTNAQSRVYRVWNRTVRGAENLSFVAQVQDQWAQLNEGPLGGADQSGTDQNR